MHIVSQAPQILVLQQIVAWHHPVTVTCILSALASFWTAKVSVCSGIRTYPKHCPWAL